MGEKGGVGSGVEKAAEKFTVYSVLRQITHIVSQLLVRIYQT